MAADRTVQRAGHRGHEHRPECLAAWEAASELLASLGHELVDIEVPLPRDAVPVFETCWAVLTALSYVNLPQSAGRCCVR